MTSTGTDRLANEIESVLPPDERGACHSCLAALLNVSFEEVHSALRLLRRRPHVTIDVNRCRSCRNERVTVRVGAPRSQRDETREALTA